MVPLVINTAQPGIGECNGATGAHPGEARSVRYRKKYGSLVELSLLDQDIGKTGIDADVHGDVAGCLGDCEPLR